MILKAIRLAMLAGAGVAAWKAFNNRQAGTQAAGSFFQEALQRGVADVEAARSAQLRGASAELRRFAQQLEHDHGQLNQGLADAAGSDLPEPDDRQRKALHALDDHQGAAYDRAWLRHMARGHAGAIRLYQRTADADGPGAALASGALSTLREHARTMEDLRRASSRTGARHAPQATA
ncbi:DUF4142 domain-containing protein [Luteimonas changyuni]|uniref:DUF4142 domain-containing protein n=1 Tax=Luteimonas sp. MJ145 TaxID=3129234 RepID=UPI0031B9B172